MLLHPTPDSIVARSIEADALSAALPDDDYSAFVYINETHSTEREALATLTVDFSAESGQSLSDALVRCLESICDNLKGNPNV